MPTWDEWGKLVEDFQKGDEYALKVLLENSRGIIEGLVARMNQVYARQKGFRLDSNDIFQKMSTMVFRNIFSLRKPNYYPIWLKQRTEKLCLRELKKLGSEIRLQAMNEREEEQEFRLDRVEDRKAAETDSFKSFQEFEDDFLEKDYENRAILKISESKEIIEGTEKEREDIFRGAVLKQLEWLMTMFGRALVDKEAYNYPEAERKLQGIIKLTDKKRLNPELKILRARAFFELGHLKMNEGLVSGNDGSILYYNETQNLWEDLKDKPNLIYTTQQIGVSHYIQGDLLTAKEIYESILKEVPKSRIFREIKANILRDLSNAYLLGGNIREANKKNEMSLQRAEDIGGTCLSYSKLQKAKIHFVRRQYEKAHQELEESIQDTPRYRVLDHVKADILKVDLYMASNQKDDALPLVPRIQGICKTHLFHHQLKKINNLLIKCRIL